MRALIARLRARLRGPDAFERRVIELAGRNAGIERRVPRDEQRFFGEFSDSTLARLRGSR